MSKRSIQQLPIEEYGFTLHKTAFRDALAFRYGWLPANTPTSCACGAAFSVEHALSCPKGGFPSIRHNEIRDCTAYLLSLICHNVSVEPHLKPITGKVPPRLDVAADGFWRSRLRGHAFFDVKVFNPTPPQIDNFNHLPVTVPMRPQRNEPMSVGSSNWA